MSLPCASRADGCTVAIVPGVGKAKVAWAAETLLAAELARSFNELDWQAMTDAERSLLGPMRDTSWRLLNLLQKRAVR